MFPSAALFAAAGAVGRALTALRNDGRFAAAEPEFITAEGYNTVVDLEAFIAREQSDVSDAALRQRFDF